VGGSLPCTAAALRAPNCPDSSPCAKVSEHGRMCPSERTAGSVCPDTGLLAEHGAPAMAMKGLG